MSPSVATVPMDLDKLEASINKPDQITPPRREISGYDEVITPAEGAPEEVGKLTAEVISKDYNATAEHLKAVINELLQTAKQCEELMHEIMDTSAVLKDAADRFQKRGQEIAGQLQISADTTAKVRAAAMEWVHMIDSTSPK